MSNWPKKTVLELQDEGILRVEDGNHGEYRPRREEFSATGTCFIRAADMKSGRIDFQDSSRINDAAVSRIRKGVGQPNDILFSHKGTVGKLAVAPPEAPQFVCSPQTTFYRVFDEEKIDRAFLFAFMRSPAFKSQWHSVKGETDMADYVSLTAQRRLLISLPPITDQRAIGSILGALDDKIDLNRRMNETLEAMARAIFKSWFVDFDPVRAKMEGRQPFGMDQATADLFPDRLVESELGLIPEGWEVTTAGDLAEHRKTSVKPQESPDSLFDHHSLPAFDSGQSPALEAGESIKSNKYAVPENAVLVTKLNPWIPRVWLTELATDQPQIASTEFVVLEPCDRKNRAAIYSFFCLAESRIRLSELAGGTSNSHQRVKPADITGLELAWNPKVGDAYSHVASPLLDQVLAQRSQSRTLAELRDLLLPKLLSGEIRVADAEQEVEAAL
ncbi:restriction endonuclease subunit S [bacterium]|nr:restriction endonuclease subunit S [bacterium]MDA7668662.1 restriction endonuclease subunit S [bacterium]MDB4632869.1 restriction endonuclease subunit S [bacterium]